MPRDTHAEMSLADNAPASTVCVLVNRGSGRRNGAEATDAIRAACEDAGLGVDLRALSRRKGIAAQVEDAISDGHHTIVAAGGDGTISGIASGVARHPGVRLGIIPLGTFNYLARSLAIPADITASVRILADGHLRRLNVGTVNDRLFMNNASLGAYPAILATREQIYRDWGRSRIAAHWSVLVALARGGHGLTGEIEIDGTRHQVSAPLMFVMTNPFQLESLRLEGAEALRDGHLALFLGTQKTRAQMIRTAVGLGLGRLEPDRDYRLMTGRKIVIRTNRKRQRVARDGEWQRMEGPFRFHAMPGLLEVLAPLSDAGQTGSTAE